MSIKLFAFPIIFFIWAFFHSLSASLTAKKLARRVLGRYYAFYRLSYVILATASLAAIWLLTPRPEGSIYHIGGVFFYVLKIVQTLALIGFVFAGSQFDMEEFIGLNDAKGFFYDNVNAAEPQPLNTGGLFAYARHPLYLFGMIILFSDPDMTYSWFAISLIFSAYMFIGAFLEERKLLALYGDEYRRYQSRVRMFLPIKKR